MIRLAPALWFVALSAVGAARPDAPWGDAGAWLHLVLAGATLALLPAARGAIALGGAGAACLLQLAVLAPWLAPGGPEAWGPPNLPPSPAWPLGTGRDGEDLMALWAWGARSAVVVAAPVAGLAVTLGAAMGLAAGWSRSRLADVLVDASLSLPMMLLQLSVVGLLRPHGGARVVVVVAVLSLTSWAQTARLVRAEARALSTSEHVLAARGLGVAGLPLLRAHVVPHLRPTLSILLAATAGHAVLAEAALSFLGIGLDAGWPSWGRQFALRQVELLVGSPAPYLFAASITAAALSLHTLADAIADRHGARFEDG